MNYWLFAGALMSGAAAVAHVCAIVGGPNWYRAMGAGNRMVERVRRKELGPTYLTLAISAALGAFALYALSGSGMIRPLPFTHAVLISITILYAARGASLPLLFELLPDRSSAFLVKSSIVSLIIGIVHGVGVANFRAV